MLCGQGPEDHSAPADLPVLGDGVRPAAGAVEAVRGWVVGVPDRFFLDGLDLVVRTAFDRAVSVITSLGIRLETVKLPASFEPAQSAHTLIMRA